jgi:hypothetical protein
MKINSKILLTAISVAVLTGVTFVAAQVAMANDRLVCLPPAVIQALS